ncbi:unnamed protein product [Adineta steineri]|uniref:J domain-containing protein n=1 Tax=Adineta steineri TaxID=433720 RepID=A0A819W739_9BILA|nr:unnamed protein product [Adineta steineri]
MSTSTPYEILGLAKTNEDVKLRIAYRKRILELKSDRQNNPTSRKIAPEKFREICRAYETLSDYEKRKIYDEDQKWLSNLDLSEYTLQQLASEPDLALSLKEQLKNSKLRLINAQGPITGQTPLYCAARACNVEAVHYLIEQDADPDLQQRSGSTALHAAAFFGHPEMVRCLLECGANYTIKNRFGNLPGDEYNEPNINIKEIFSELKETLFVQTAANQFDWLKANIDRIGDHIDTEYYTQRQTLLHCACKKGYFDLVKWFVEERHANLDLVDINLNTPLHLAAYGGYEKIVDYLLSKGANSILINRWGMTAEQEGIVHGTKIKELFQAMRDMNMFDMAIKGIVWWFQYYFEDKSPNSIDGQGTSLLYVACRFGQTSVAEWLLDKGANINFQLPGKRSTPLHGAAFNKHLSTVELLLSRGADINIKNSYSSTPIDDAQTDEIKKLLQQHRDNLAIDKYIPVHLYSDGKKAGDGPLAKVQLHCDATIDDLIKALPDKLRDSYKWFSIARSPLDFADDKTTLISAVCRARHVNSIFLDLPICLIAYTSPRYINSGYRARDPRNGLNLRTFHSEFRSKQKDQSFCIKGNSNEPQIFRIDNVSFKFPPCCTNNDTLIDINYIFSPDAKKFQLPECICLFETAYNVENEKLNDMPTITVDNEPNIKLYTWVSSSAYWFSHTDQDNRLPRIGGIQALIRHVEVIPKSLCLLPDMFIQNAVGKLFEKRQTPVSCQYLKIQEPDVELFPHQAYHGTSINVIRSILMDGLVMPSTVVSNGFRVCPPAGHIARGVQAFGIPDFANALFVSPSIHYCSDPVYAVTFSSGDQQMIAVLDCRIRNDAFKAFASTVPSYVAHPGDDIKAIEWRITCPAAIQITGIIFIPTIQSRAEAARLRASKLDMNPNNVA